MSTSIHSTNNPGLISIERDLFNTIVEEISRLGILCRVFSRVKSEKSIAEKFARKGTGYYNKERMMQDLFGIRIVAYFYEDLDFVDKLLSRVFEEVGRNVDEGGLTEFKPLPRNIVFRLPKKDIDTLMEIKASYSEFEYVDTTFEIQLRSVLSEGWHEVDHVLRYKCHDEWLEIPEYDRMLNGIYATLETSDKALKALFDDVAYSHYKKQNITGMLRTKFRLDFLPTSISPQIYSILISDKVAWKKINRINRQEFLNSLSESRISLPMTFDNLVFIINRLYLDLSEIKDLEPLNVKRDLDELHFENSD